VKEIDLVKVINDLDKVVVTAIMSYIESQNIELHSFGEVHSIRKRKPEINGLILQIPDLSSKKNRFVSSTTN